MIICGIGSRETPADVLHQMKIIGTWCRDNQIWVRSGHAPGADSAFEQGAQEYCIAYIPWATFGKEIKSRAHIRIVNPRPELISLARAHHPIFDTLKDSVKLLMLRNGAQILGENLDSPVTAVVCWTKDGGPSGGTGQALRIAQRKGIPVLNMYKYPSSVEVIDELMGYRDAFAEKHIE